MSYYTQGLLAEDRFIVMRATACATVEEVPDAPSWVAQRMWRFSAQPGWVDAYKRATSDEPGTDEGAVTDQMILEAVRRFRAEGLDGEPPPPTPETPLSPAE